MAHTDNLELPFVEGGQAQKHITVNEAFRILDASVQIGVLDTATTVPPSSPSEGERHIIATGATGAWLGHDHAIATFEDGTWRFLSPKAGWFAWSAAENVLFAYDGVHWRDMRDLPFSLESIVRVGINTAASGANRLSVKSNAALFTAVPVADSGTGDARVQISKETAGNTASVVFSNNYSGRAEFGLIASDAFKLKVSADGSTFNEALSFEAVTANATLSRGLSMTAAIAPSLIAANQNDYNPPGLSTASLLQVSSDAARTVSGLAGGSDGRMICVINTGSQIVTLLDDNTASSAANRFRFGADVAIAPKQALTLRYDATASRWYAVARSGAGALLAPNNLSELSSKAVARSNLGVRDVLTANRAYYVRTDGNDANDGLSNTSGGAFLTIQKAVGTVSGLDVGSYNVTISVANGTYTNPVSLRNFQGTGRCTISGTSSAIVSTTSNHAISASQLNSLWTIQGLKIATVTSGAGVFVDTGSVLTLDSVEFGACASAHINATDGGEISTSTGYAISGGAPAHWLVSDAGRVIWSGSNTLTITGTPAFSTAFAALSSLGCVRASGKTFSGGASGVRYNVTTNAVCSTGGAGASYFPGSTAGTTATGGSYT